MIITLPFADFWGFKSMRMLISLTFCLSVLVNAMAQNTLGMAMVCMVNSTNADSNKNSSDVDDNTNCPPIQDAMNDYQV